MLFIQPRVQW